MDIVIPPGHAAIPTPSTTEAEEWSLVLASQNISYTLVHDDPENRWYLVVTETDVSRATQAIEQYEHENRGWTLCQRLPWSHLLFHWGSLFWVISILLFHIFTTQVVVRGHELGMMSNTAVARGQWWRMFTAVTLHADAAHLAANAGIGFVLLGFAMARFGAGWALLMAFLAGAAGNALGFALYPPAHNGLGASGMVMGALGLVAVQTVGVLRQHGQVRRLLFSGLIVGLFMFILLGTDPQSDIVAHAGGFLGGILLGGFLLALPDRWQQSWVANMLALLAMAVLTVTAWWLAIPRV